MVKPPLKNAPTGTTAVAALEEKRKFIGSDISKEYVDLSNNRLKPYLTQISIGKILFHRGKMLNYLLNGQLKDSGAYSLNEFTALIG